MAQSACSYIGPVILYPIGACATSMIVAGCEEDLVVQLGWDADPDIKPGDTCHLYKFGKRIFVSQHHRCVESAEKRLDSLLEKALAKSTTK